MTLRYGTVCSGIEAPSVAWDALGFKPQFFSEIEKFPSRVLAHHYPDVPNHGDMTKFKEWPDHAIDILVGGTPCQSFSVAGLRKGMADPRGNLALTYLAIAERYKPSWIVWENVPGVLSSNGGRDFGAFIGAMGQVGYGFAYRVLDAQFFGVAQRRRRVFVVGYLGDWRPAAAVLFERDCLSGNPAPRRETGQETAGTLKARAKSGGWGQDVDMAAGGYMRPVGYTSSSFGAYGEGCGTLRREGGDLGGGSETLIASTGNVAHCLNAGGMGRQDYETETMITTQYGDIAGALTARHDSSPCADRGQNVIAQSVSLRGRDGGATAELGGDISPAIRASQGGGDKPHVLTSAVRRLTPIECERLQGFPDDYTNIPKAADGPRYKALGNSMAVPVMSWIGERIQTVDEIFKGEK